MTMWVSADAINAEIEYRREDVRRTSRAVRWRRSARRERARQMQQPRAGGTAVGRDDRRAAVALPPQRTSEPVPAAKQPV